MTIYENILRLTSYALNNSLITKEDIIYTQNKLLALFRLDGFETPVAPELPQVKTEAQSSDEPDLKKEEADEALSDLKAQADDNSEDNIPDAKKVEKKEEGKASNQADTKKIREKIISMYHQGYSLLDIAKETGKGIGEVTLILELFDEKEEKASE